MLNRSIQQTLTRDSVLTCLSASYSSFASPRSFKPRNEDSTRRQQRRVPVERPGSSSKKPTAAPADFRASKEPRKPLATAAAAAPSSVKKYRSKHFDPTEEKKDLPLLEPHILSGRLKKLCEQNKLEAAVTMLKNSPLDAQNAVVWNTVIWECMKAKQFQKAYTLYVDMKRRGFSPTTRTFQTMFNGLSRIEDWSAHPKQLGNVQLLFNAYMRHIESLFKDDPKSEEISSSPLALYMKILGDAGRYQDIFDVYYDLDPKGALKPDHLVYTAMFQALSPLRIPYGVDSEAATEQNASSAKHLWMQMLKDSKRNNFAVDSHLVAAAILSMCKGRPADQEFAFGIARDYLAIPKDPKAGSKQLASIPLSSPTLAAVLMLCRSSGKHQLCIDIFDEVRQRYGATSIVDRGHVEDVFRSRSTIDPPPSSADYELSILDWMIVTDALRSGKKLDDPLRPLMSTFLLTLAACLRTTDFRSAVRTFELITGFHGHDFMDGSEASNPRFDQRSANRNHPPTAENLSFVVRAAVKGGNKADMRQALRMVHFCNFDNLVYGKADSAEASKSKKALKNLLYHGEKLASSVLDAIDHLLRNSTERDRPSPSDLVKWRELKASATEIAQIAQSSRLVPVKDAT